MASSTVAPSSGISPTTSTMPAIDPVIVRRSRDLLDRAEILFDNADGIEDSAEQFRQYYLAALRAAGAAIEVYEPSNRPARRKATSRSAWNRLPVLVPELAWAAGFFAHRSRLRGDIESGLVRSVDADAIAVTRMRVTELLDAVDALLTAYEQGRLSGQGAHSSRTA